MSEHKHEYELTAELDVLPLASELGRYMTDIVAWKVAKLGRGEKVTVEELVRMRRYVKHKTEQLVWWLEQLIKLVEKEV